MGEVIETLQGNFTEVQTLQIRREENQKGNRVNITRLHSKAIRIEIIAPDRTIQAMQTSYRVKQLE